MKSSINKVILSVATLLAAPAAAQDPEIPRFEDVTVETVRPDGVPRAERAGPGQVILRHASRLPSPPNGTELAKLDELARPLVYKLAALRTPPKPYRQDPMVFKGHASWLSARADGASPLLVTSSSWLDGADSVFILPPDPRQPRGGVQGGSVSAKFVSFETSRPGQEARDLLARKGELVELVVVRRDAQRNLALLAPKEAGALERPARGLTLFPFRERPIAHLFGVSPAASTLLSHAQLAGRPAHPGLQYYLSSTFSALFGAPLVSTEGEVLTITAGLDPDRPGVSLVVPPGSLSAFVAGVQGVTDPNAEIPEKLGEERDTLPPIQ